MRPISLSVVLIALGPLAFCPPAFAQGTTTESGGVTVLRGPGASPPTPPAAPPAPAQTTIIQRDTIYQPVYVDPPGYGYGYVGVGPTVGATVGPGVNPPRRAAPTTPPAQSNVPNGWPLVQGGRR